MHKLARLLGKVQVNLVRKIQSNVSARVSSTELVVQFLRQTGHAKIERRKQIHTKLKAYHDFNFVVGRGQATGLTQAAVWAPAGD